jgi:hypothetical protein
MASDKALLALADDFDREHRGFSVASRLRALVKAHPEEPGLREALVKAALQYWAADDDGMDEAYEELMTAASQLAATGYVVEPTVHEPGELIAKVDCPCCGAALSIEHGDDEGEISVVGTPAPAAPADLREALLRELDARCIHSIRVGPFGGPLRDERCILLESARTAVDAALASHPRPAEEGKP